MLKLRRPVSLPLAVLCRHFPAARRSNLLLTVTALQRGSSLPRGHHVLCKRASSHNLRRYSLKEARRFLVSASSPLNGFASSALPLERYRRTVAAGLSRLSGLPVENILPKVSLPSTLEAGDLNVPVAALGGKDLIEHQKNAEKWSREFVCGDLIESVEASGAFLRVFINTSTLAEEILPQIITQGKEYGTCKEEGLKDPSNPAAGSKKLVVEFSSPNIAKPFHAGHLRSTIIGGFLANLYEAAGWEVVRINYLGDWGKQFGLLATAFEAYGDEAKLKDDPIGHLFELYVRINKEAESQEDSQDEAKDNNEQRDPQEKPTASAIAERDRSTSIHESARNYFRRLENGDKDALALWKRFRDLSIARYKSTYARLNIHFDAYLGESQVAPSRIADVVSRLRQTSLCRDDRGALLIDFTSSPQGKSLGKAILEKQDGATIYLSRDIAEALQRQDKYDFDKMIYVVASAQERHLAQVFRSLELAGFGEVAEKCQHVNFGLVKGMSTRRGTVRFLDDVLSEASDTMHEVMKANEDKYQLVENPEATAELLGISAVVVQDMKGKRRNDYTFSAERMTSFEGDTGPYLQYAHARLYSISRNARAAGISPPSPSNASAVTSSLTEPHAKAIVRTLALYPHVIRTALRSQEPSAVVTYLFRLAHSVSAGYSDLRVVGEADEEKRQARLALFEATRRVLANGMELLGVGVVERM